MMNQFRYGASEENWFWSFLRLIGEYAIVLFLVIFLCGIAAVWTHFALLFASKPLGITVTWEMVETWGLFVSIAIPLKTLKTVFVLKYGNMG